MERVGVAGLVGVVGRSHESSAALQVGGISGKVGMNAFGCITVDPLKFGRRGEVVSFGRLAVSVFVSLACLFAGLLCLDLRGGRRIKPGLQLGNSRLPFVQFSVKSPHLP